MFGCLRRKDACKATRSGSHEQQGHGHSPVMLIHCR
jgi:hypothetical protein